MRSRHASLIAARLSIGCARRGSGSAWVNRSLPPCVRNKGYQKSSAGPMPLGPSAVAPTPHAPLPHNWSSRLGLASAALAEAGLLERSHRPVGGLLGCLYGRGSDSWVIELGWRRRGTQTYRGYVR